jgi:hypothetical protein
MYHGKMMIHILTGVRAGTLIHLIYAHVDIVIYLCSYQDGSTYQLSITWNDGVQTGNPTSVIITVTSTEADLPPLWDNTGGMPIDDVTTFEVYENETWSPIPSLDFSTNKVGILETLRGATLYENSEFHFTGNGEQSLILKVSANLDYESVPRYSIRIRASVSIMISYLCKIKGDGIIMSISVLACADHLIISASVLVYADDMIIFTSVLANVDYILLSTFYSFIHTDVCQDPCSELLYTFSMCYG